MININREEHLHWSTNLLAARTGPDKNGTSRQSPPTARTFAFCGSAATSRDVPDALVALFTIYKAFEEIRLPRHSQTLSDPVSTPESQSNEQSDGEEPTNVEEVQAEGEVEVAADGGDGGKSGSMSVLDALKGVLKIALIHDGLARGLREASKALDRRQAHMCVLNEACEEEAYKKLVVALCGEHKIPLIKVPDGKQLGEWAGLCQIDREGNARKVVNCSCVVVKDWGEESQERSVLLNYFQTEQ
ncbi:hypothetical protein D0865_14737 [Hortaea werneckii]|uniref:40S ribosomal protein S12 n=4 Tax=Teratosphaeriaceae TaxID=668547 RepID=A0A3M7AXY6_HORWE|nr:hypothetical protein D0865_14737 [Hortaea werneckii]